MSSTFGHGSPYHKQETHRPSEQVFRAIGKASVSAMRFLSRPANMISARVSEMEKKNADKKINDEINKVKPLQLLYERALRERNVAITALNEARKGNNKMEELIEDLRKKEGNLVEARVNSTYGKIALDKVYREYKEQATKNVQKDALANGALEEEMAAIAKKERRAANRRAASSGANRGLAGGSNKKPLKKVVKKLVKKVVKKVVKKPLVKPAKKKVATRRISK